jgi:hypothetical protein
MKKFLIAFETIALIGLLIFISGCDTATNNSSSTQTVERPDVNAADYPKLHPSLIELITIETPDKLANALGADYAEGMVTVIIEFRDLDVQPDLEWAVNALGGEVQTSVSGMLQARMKLDSLLDIATHPRLEYVRIPVKPIVK